MHGSRTAAASDGCTRVSRELIYRLASLENLYIQQTVSVSIFRLQANSEFYSIDAFG